MKIIFFYSVFLLLLSCQSPIQKDVNKALQSAGENRSELEKVLRHYKNDTLKYRAAQFLIANMPGHYSYGGKIVDAYYFSVDSLFRNGGAKKEVIDELARQYNVLQHIELIEDVKNMTAEYLIDNIDRAFDDWQQRIYNDHVDFDHFCEYLLPYRIANESLEYWRDMLAGKFTGIENLNYIEGDRASAYWVCSFINSRLRNNHAKISFQLHNSFLPTHYSSLDVMSYGSCKEFAFLVTFAMRGKGVPVTIDFTPQWAHIPDAHYWCVVYVKRGKNILFEPMGADPGQRHREETVKSKVYRYCYAIDKSSLAYRRGNEEVPSLFKVPFFKDVTPEYTVTSDVEVKLRTTPHKKRKFAYVCTFNNRQWVPVDFAEIEGKRACFTQLGRDIVYLPAFYIDGAEEQAAFPFILDSRGRVRHLQPDTTHLRTIRLTRKYPLPKRVFEHNNKMLEGRFQAADNPAFNHPVTFHMISRNAGGAFDTVQVNPERQKYRYWRYLGPKGSFCHIAELKFFVSDSIQPLSGRTIGAKGPVQNAFDNNSLTFYEHPRPNGGWVGIDLGKSLAIDKIVYQSHNDDNFVFPGDEYELFYRGPHEWISLGKQKAEKTWLEYSRVPANALLWLRDLSKGSEERIFTWENNEPMWW